ncbi:MAG: SDR family NAD(P)-dependent oxidoreductase [Actinomycetota bacterium]|nr:SDR family NAD(P)-dependent oxidoreductase [Actinomycetota bacterium]
MALVTGASRGLGRASAVALAREGVKVTICARGEEALREAEEEISRYGEVLSLVADVTQPPVPAQLVTATVERFGTADILVANAGGPPPGRALEVDDRVLVGALEANLLTSVRLVREAVPHMRRAGWGRICLITSATVKEPIPTLAASGTARAGLWGWAKPAAQDLFGEGITLNLACPGSHATERMQELGSGGGGPVGDPAAFGEVVAFLCSEPARFVSGTAVLVDGARTAGL